MGLCLGVYLKGFVLFVSPLIGCTGSSILHCEFSIFFVLSCASRCLCPHSMASPTSAPLTVPPLCTHRAPPRGACPCVQNWCRDRLWNRPVASCCPERFSFPLGFPITDTAMSICCAPRTCSGQAGVLGNGAQPSVGTAFKLATGPVRKDLTVRAVMWWVLTLLFPTHNLELGVPSQQTLGVLHTHWVFCIHLIHGEHWVFCKHYMLWKHDMYRHQMLCKPWINYKHLVFWVY